MKSIKVTDLKGGMIFSEAVYIEDNNILVPPEIPIKQKDIDRLINWDIVEVFTDGNVIGMENGEVVDFLHLGVSPESRKKSFTFITDGISVLDRVFQDVKKGVVTPTDYELLNKVVEEILANMNEDPGVLFQNAVSLGAESGGMSVRALNCAVFSALIGKEVLRSKQDLQDLILAALLHDVGMIKVPDSILYKKEKLSIEELKTIKGHPNESFNIIQKMGFIGKVPRLVLYHHEKWNGTGYPEKMKGTSIPIGSRILAVADAFEALINNRPYRKYQIGYSAIKAILSDNGTHFDPDILKVFLRTIGIYPIGSVVELNDGSFGKVVNVNPRAPLRPVLVIIKGERPDQEIDLMENKNLFITKAVDPKEVEEA